MVPKMILDGCAMIVALRTVAQGYRQRSYALAKEKAGLNRTDSGVPTLLAGLRRDAIAREIKSLTEAIQEIDQSITNEFTTILELFARHTAPRIATGDIDDEIRALAQAVAGLYAPPVSAAEAFAADRASEAP